MSGNPAPMTALDHARAALTQRLLGEVLAQLLEPSDDLVALVMDEAPEGPAALAYLEDLAATLTAAVCQRAADHLADSLDSPPDPSDGPNEAEAWIDWIAGRPA